MIPVAAGDQPTHAEPTVEMFTRSDALRGSGSRDCETRAVTAVELRLLGPVQLGPIDGHVPFGGPKQRAVLASWPSASARRYPPTSSSSCCGPTSSGRPTPAEHSRCTSPTCASCSRIRALDIAGSGADYRLVAARDAVDVTVFEDLVAEASHLADDHPVDALALHQAARELWRGRALSDLVTEIAGLEGDALRLDEQRLHAAEQRLGLAVRYGDRDAAVVELEAMIAAEPWRELAVAHLMVGLYGQGRQADALAVGAAACARLVDELGLDPSPVLRDVEQQVLEHRLTLPGRRTAAVVDGGVGCAVGSRRCSTRFVGRTEELDRLADAGDGSRLRTVVGTGGVGKTRLALEAAHRCPHPAVFVPLSATDPSGVVRATIAATGPADRAGGDGCRDGGGLRRRARRPAGVARPGQRRARARREGALGHRTAARRADADRDRHLTRAAGDPR